MELVHNEAFNVGATAENYKVRDVAEIVREVVPNTEVTFAESASGDNRNYRVSCEKIARVLPSFQPQWTVRKGVEEIYEAFRRHTITRRPFTGPSYQRLKQVRNLLDSGRARQLAALAPPRPRCQRGLMYVVRSTCRSAEGRTWSWCFPWASYPYRTALLLPLQLEEPERRYPWTGVLP